MPSRKTGVVHEIWPLSAGFEATNSKSGFEATVKQCLPAARHIVGHSRLWKLSARTKIKTLDLGRLRFLSNGSMGVEIPRTGREPRSPHRILQK